MIFKIGHRHTQTDTDFLVMGIGRGWKTPPIEFIPERVVGLERGIGYRACVTLVNGDDIGLDHLLSLQPVEK